jgi:glyoxylase-like metal-dependent hydrolase (beta-lactamase superfamily II)
MTEVPSQFTWDVYVTAEEPIVTDDLPRGATERRWPPISATLISAGRDAVLVDPLMTADQAHGLGDWIAASGKNLTAIFVTHGHGDHWFGLRSGQQVRGGQAHALQQEQRRVDHGLPGCG